MVRQEQRFVFVVNNWTEEQYQLLIKNSDKLQYITMGQEIGPKNGTPHLQGYLETKTPCSYKQVHKLIGFKNLSLDWAKGTAEENDDYTGKDNVGVYRRGTKLPPKSQGKRTDLKLIVQGLTTGKITMLDILMDYPQFYTQYNKTFCAANQVYLKTLKRTEMTQLIWVVGGTGTGKSHFAFSHSRSYYSWPYDGEWCDEYEGEEVLVINEYRGTIKYDLLLQMSDKWPCSMRRRNIPPYPFISKYIVITSVLTPEECYPNREKNDCIQQLLRRCKVVDLNVMPRIENYNLDMFLSAGVCITPST